MRQEVVKKSTWADHLVSAVESDYERKWALERHQQLRFNLAMVELMVISLGHLHSLMTYVWSHFCLMYCKPSTFFQG